MWDKGIRILNKADPMFDKFAANAVTVGLRITNPNFGHLALPYCKQIMAKKMQELWNNQTSCYRDHLTKCEFSLPLSVRPQVQNSHPPSLLLRQTS